MMRHFLLTFEDNNLQLQIKIYTHLYIPFAILNALRNTKEFTETWFRLKLVDMLVAISVIDTS